MSDLASVVIGNPDDDARIPQWREGVVTQVSPLLVRVGSATTAKPCNALASYLPRLGDAVSVLVLSGDRLVLGTVTRAPTPGTIVERVSGAIPDVPATVTGNRTILSVAPPSSSYLFPVVCQFTVALFFGQSGGVNNAGAGVHSNALAVTVASAPDPTQAANGAWAALPIAGSFPVAAGNTPSFLIQQNNSALTGTSHTGGSYRAEWVAA